MKNVHTILVPVDFSAESVCAVQYAKDLAWLFGSRICLLHVVEPQLTPWPTGLGFTSQRMREDERLEAVYALGALIRQEGLDPATTSAMVVNARCVDAIPLYADDITADLIVMGLHDERVAGRFLGHVIERVMRSVACPVLALPPLAATKIDEPSAYVDKTA
jgi:nucleotide-binding universal stress UspA family protein